MDIIWIAANATALLTVIATRLTIFAELEAKLN